MRFNKYCIRATPIRLSQHTCPKDFFIQNALSQIDVDPPTYETMPLEIREQVITMYALLQTNPAIFDSALPAFAISADTHGHHLTSRDHLRNPVITWYDNMLPAAKKWIYNTAESLATINP